MVTWGSMTFLKVPPNLPMFPRILCKYSKDALPPTVIADPIERFVGDPVAQGEFFYWISIGI